ncbi:hypothetical protein EXIGLDRAFT_637823 [Exidia glandulosa HHB12029]|uniref:DUF7789 domain-containing protein n=1 Tax=Exidia glandulosa HHB12029 TaxID=1314781 RepID=A0A165PE69_EXIGL|nr:hypothetical protein EXIGLDRAFT_637823 [Exidia glandulosa HHB12029]
MSRFQSDPNGPYPYRTEHVELPVTRSPADYAPHYPPSSFRQDQDELDYDHYDAKQPPFDYAPSQRGGYPMFHKDPSYMSDISDHTAVDRSPQPGLPVQQQLAAEPESSGFWIKILPNSMACRLYLLTVLIETIVDIAIEVDLLVLLNQQSHTSADRATQLEFERLPVYLVVFGLAHLFQLVLALDAVHAQNTLQFLFLAGFNALLLAYAIVQASEIREFVNPNTPGLSHIPVNVMTTIIAVVIGLCEIGYIVLGWKIYTEFGWKVYKLLGADRSVKRMFVHLQVFLCLIKFDQFFFVGFTVQWIFLVLGGQEQQGSEYYMTIIALPFSVVVLIAGHVAAHRERKWLMGVFICGLTAASVYFIYKFYRILKSRDDPDFAPVFKSLTIFSVLATFLLFVTFTWACIVMHNFGRGLKARVAKHKKGQASIAMSSRTGRTRRTTNMEAMAAHPHRISID